MPKTITITVPGNTTVVLPESGTLRKSLGGTVTLGIENESGQAITLAEAGSAAKFSVGTVPASIDDGESDSIELTLIDEGDVDFDDEEEQTTVSVIFAPTGPLRLVRAGAFSAGAWAAGGFAPGAVRAAGYAPGATPGAGEP